MSATLESRTLIVSARRLRVLKAALAGMEIEAIEPAEWVTTGVQAAGLLITPRQEATSYAGPVATLIPAAGRLLLAIAERLGRDRGIGYVLCDYGFDVV